MRTRSLSVLVGVIASVTLLLSGVAWAGGATPTKITIKGPNGDFHGRILSTNTDCLGDRRVAVFEQLGDTQDPSTDDRIATDTSQRQGTHGEWSVGNTGFRDGFFYAKVGRTPSCKGDRSKTIELVDGVPQ
jgi:hypothetical protein